jgi:hypothetical protein
VVAVEINFDEWIIVEHPSHFSFFLRYWAEAERCGIIATRRAVIDIVM